MQVQDTDPLAPAAGQSPGNPTPQGFSGDQLTSGWNDWINKPNNRAALAQFGIAMLQPMGMGETGMGHFANAVGAAGEAHRHVTTEAEQDEKARTEAEARTLRANAAETSANAAETRAMYAGQNNDLRTTNNLLKTQIQARRDYDTYAKGVDKQNLDNGLLGEPKIEKLDFETWFRSTGGVQGDTGGTVRGPAAAVAPTGTGHSSRTDEVLDHPTIKSQMPVIQQAARSSDPKQRQAAQNYFRERVEPYIDPMDVPRVKQLYGVQ